MTSSTPRDWIATYDPADPALKAAIRRRKIRAYWLFVPVFVLVFGFYRGWMDATERFDPFGVNRLLGDAPAWLASLTIGAASVLMIIAFVVSVRPATYAVIQSNPRAVLTRAESRRVGRQIRGQEPVAPHEVAFLRDVALAMYAQRWGVVSMTGVLLLAVGGGMLGGDGGAVVPIVLGIVPIVVGVLCVRTAVHARRFLRSVGVAPV